MTDAELTTRILDTIQEHGQQALRNLTRMIDPPGGYRAVRRCLQAMTEQGSIYPRTHYGLVVYGLDRPAPRPQNQRERPQQVNQYDEPAGTVIVHELGPGHRRVVFGRQWRAGKGLSGNWPSGGICSGMARFEVV